MSVKLSASRIDTLNTCSWVYHGNYVLRLPDESNDGAKRGSVVHDTLELLLEDRDEFDKIISQSDVFASTKYKQIILDKAAFYSVDDEENLSLIKDFLLTALHHDFYCAGSNLVKAEGKFDIQNKSPRYHITGFLDQLALYEKENRVYIRDFKTSKMKFSGEKKEFNIQAYMYCLAARHLYPSFAKRDFEFLFLKFKRAPVQKVKNFTEEDLNGFEHYLEHLTNYLEKFSIRHAMSNFAADNKKNYWLCGKFKGDLNVRGEPAFICKFKYAYDYWAVVDAKTGKTIKTAFMEDRADIDAYVKKLKPGSYKIEVKHYGGCPKFRKRLKGQTR